MNVRVRCVREGTNQAKAEDGCFKMKGGMVGDDHQVTKTSGTCSPMLQSAVWLLNIQGNWKLFIYLVLESERLEGPKGVGTGMFWVLTENLSQCILGRGPQ